MAEQKQYLIEIPGMEGSDVWDAARWERNRDKLLADHPDTNVFELDAYNPDDENENDQYVISLPDTEGADVWDAARWDRNKEAFMTDHPEASVQRVRYVDYWGERATENRARREELTQPDADREARLASIGYFDDMSGDKKSFGLGGPMGLKPLSSAVQQNSVTGEVSYLDPKVADFYANDTAYTERMAEIARLDAEYESNPSVVAEREWLAQVEKERTEYVSKMREETQASMEENVDKSAWALGYSKKHNPGVATSFATSGNIGKQTLKGMQENEKAENYQTAMAYWDKADRVRAEHSTFAQGAKNVAMNWWEEFQSQDDLETFTEVASILKRLEKEHGDLNEISDEAIENSLTDDEKYLIRSFLEYNTAMAEAGADMTKWYKGGQIAAEAVPFMLEILMTGGLYKAAGEAATKGVRKGLAKWIMKSAKGSAARATKAKVAKGLTGKAGAGIISALAGTAARTAVAPGTYTRMAEATTQIDEEGHLNVVKNMGVAAIDAYIENLSEESGIIFKKAFGLAGKGVKELGKAIGGNTFAKIGQTLGKNATMQALVKGYQSFMPKLEALGFHGLPEEIGEEILGNALREVTFVQPGALKEMFVDGNFGTMLIGFAPMTIIGAAGSAANIGFVNMEAARLGEELRTSMSGHYTKDQIDLLVSGIQSAENAEQVQAAITPMILAIDAAQRSGAITAEQAKNEAATIYNYGMFVAKNKAMLFAQGEQNRELADAKRAALTDTYGKFWREDAEGSQSVQIARLNDGRDVFVVSEPAENGQIAVVNIADGKTGFANTADISTSEAEGEQKQNSNTWTIDQYLDAEIAMGRKSAERARMENERNAQIEALRAGITEGTKINLGTEGSPVMVVARGTTKEGVRVVDSTGSEFLLGWEQAADALGAPIKVKTDKQIVDEEIAAIAQRNAERRKRSQVSSSNAVQTSEQVAADAEQTVQEDSRHIPMNEDGTVNESAFWEQSPEDYAAWNDEQNQDGGADTLEQIAIAKSELAGLITQAQQAVLTSNPATRKAAKREVQRLQERLARIEALEQSYISRATAPYRERAERWMGLTGAQVHIIETAEELAQVSLTAAQQSSTEGNVTGFAKDGKAYIYLPGITSEAEVDAVFIHEAVAHLGLKGLLGQQQFDELCAQVWNMMSAEARRVFLQYPGVNGSPLAAADEYIAHIAENIGAGIAEEAELTVWEKIVELVRNFLRAMGISLAMTEKELFDLLSMSYADLAKNLQSAEQMAEQKKQSEEQMAEMPTEAQKRYAELSQDLTPEEIKEVAQNDYNAALEAYNAHVANAPKVEVGESSKSFIERKKAYNEKLAELLANLASEEAFMNEVTKTEAPAVIGEEAVAEDAPSAEETLEEDGFEADEQNDDVRFSVRYLPTQEQREQIVESIVKVTGRTAEVAERWLNSELSLASIVLGDRQYLDYAPDAKYKAIKDNSDYPQGTVDFNNICRKRNFFTQMYTRLQRAYPNHIFTAEGLADIRTMMSEDGLTVACGLCYVEDRRQKLGEVASEFIADLQDGFKEYGKKNDAKRANAVKFNALVSGDTYVPSIYDLITLEGSDRLYEEHRGIWEAFGAYNRARGQQTQNTFQGYAEYKREILGWSDAKVRKVNSLGGLRVFSYSDFEAHHLLDLVQIIIDCASKGVMIQGYTKVPEFARAVAETGIKLNRSLIPLGDTGIVDGKLAYDPVEGIDINDPNFLESNDNVGNILIGINDEQIRMAMADPFVNYIIPYHARQAGTIRAKLNVGAWTNYIDVQNERDMKTGKRVKENINIYTEVLDNTITNDREFVEKYLEVCRQKGFIPKFDQFLDKDAEGNYVYTPGYYKFLVDFKLFDEAGNILPQKPVVAQFDDAFNAQILADYAKEQRETTGEQMNSTYEKIVETLDLGPAEGEDIRFSIRTDEQREKLFEDAKAHYGVTKNFNAAGYMLPDGSLLDFSEANDGGDPNSRSLDHRDIEGIIMDNGVEYDSRWMYIADFMNEGAIRLLPEYAGINLMKAPTKEQRQRLMDFIYKFNGEVILEIADERLNNIAYVEYDRRTSPARIFRDIDGYFNEGIVPEQDVRFSVVFDSANSELEKDGISINNETLMKEYGLSDIVLSKNNDYVTLSKIVVNDKNKGNGTRFMQDLVKDADENGWTLALTPDDTFGATSVSRLKKFYKRFGFKENKGRNADFNTRESMVRTPESGVRFRATAISEEVAAEMADIKKKADADGTFMKAPNGKPTNLTEEQWLMVRTKNFKNWFGDWELAANVRHGLDALRQMAEGVESVPNAMRRDELAELGGTAEIEFAWGKEGKPDRNGYIRKGSGFAKILQKHGVEDALRVVGTIATGEIQEPYGPENAKRVDIVSGEYQTTISLYKDGVSGSWVLTGFKIDPSTDAKGRGSDLSNATQGFPIHTREDLGAALASDANIRYFNELTSNSSKVVDENGEPMIMHHGSAWEPLMEPKGKAIFRMNDGLLGKGAYFSNVLAEATIYAETATGLDTSEEGNYELLQDKYVTDYFLNVRNEEDIYREGDDMVVVAKNPSQIKSATDNTGAFSENDNDIRFRVRGENESAEDFYSSAIEDYKAKYTSLADMVVYPINEKTAEKFGRTQEELAQTGADYVMEDGEFAIFVHEDVADSIVVENTIFHEDIHFIADAYPHMYNLGNWLWNNADVVSRFKAWKDYIESEYDADQYADEMLAYCVSEAMSLGQVTALEGVVPTEYHSIIRQLENEIGYDRRSEESRREAERILQQSGRSEDLGEQEGVQGEKGSTGKSGLTAEERRVINEFFPGAFRVTDSKGNTLTPEQEAFFANSKAVDKDGNLLVLYHGTPRAGFTEFKSGWFTTSKEDAISYSGDRKGRLFDPNERYVPEVLEAGDFRLGYMTFDSEADRDAFLAGHPEAAEAMSEREFDQMTLEADEEYDVLIARKPELQKIWNAYREYERDRFVDTTIKEMLDNPDAYTEDDFRRAMLTHDSNVIFDEIDEMDDAADRKEALIDALNYAVTDAEENGGDLLTMPVTTRVPRNGSGLKHNDLGNRTYEVYINIENPYEIDAKGKHSELESGDIYDAVREALASDQYDGAIIRNWRVGRNQQLGDVVVPKNGSQIKLTSNQAPTEDGDIRFRTIGNTEEFFTEEDAVSFRVVTDQAEIDAFEASEKMKAYRNVVMLEDGSFEPPMANSLRNTGKAKVKTSGFKMNELEKADENPDLADENGKIDLVKPDGKTVDKVDYNPYIHNRLNKVNSQFKQAWERPNLVYIETEVSLDDLNSGYHADKAKKPVGIHKWSGGKLVLSRYDKPIRIVPWEEVADDWVKKFKKKGVHFDIVPPALRPILVERGVNILPPHKGMGENCFAAYEAWKSGENPDGTDGGLSFRVTGTPTEQVVAEGVSLSPAQLASLAGDIFAALPEDVRKRITDSLGGNILNLQDAVMQIPVDLAVKEEWDDEDKAVARIVADEMTKMTGREMTRPFYPNEALWMLYDSTHRTDGTDIISEATKALVRRNLGFSPRMQQLMKEIDEHIRYRSGISANNSDAIDFYNSEVNQISSRLAEVWLDMNESVIKMQDALAKATGMPIESWENVVLALNQLSSINLADKKKYMRDFLESLWSIIDEIIRTTGLSREQVERYMMLKHGLERNEVFAKRDAKAYYREIYDDILDKVRNMTQEQKRQNRDNARKRYEDAVAERDRLRAIDSSALTDDQKDDLRKERAKATREADAAEKEYHKAEKIYSLTEAGVEHELSQIYDDINAGVNEKYREFRKEDYGGLTSMFSDYRWWEIKPRSAYASEEEYQRAVLAARTPRYDDLEDMEAEAATEIHDYEDKLGNKKDILWNRVNAATKETLRHQYDSNMLTKEQFDAVSSMFEFYVPLRGFADNTAQDMYDYYTSNPGNGFSAPIIAAKGRKSKAESPLGWIGSMAESAIQADNKNEVKLRLYYLATRRPNNGLLTVSETWYEYKGEKDDKGRKVFVPAYPPEIKRHMTAEELAAHMQTWEDEMRKKQANGDAYTSSQKLDLHGSVVFHDGGQDEEHTIRVKVGGKDYTMMVNGNPRAAQAINGLLNPDLPSDSAAVNMYKKGLRSLSALMTSWSPLFWVTNFQRDMLSSIQRTQLRHGAAYAAKYAMNRSRAWRVIKYIGKYQNAPLGDSYYEKLYTEFAENGGITGYTVLANNKEQEQMFEKYLKDQNTAAVAKWFKNAFGKVMDLGEAIEQVSRFAAYITARESGMGIEEAINEAKEVSVNFNRKGSMKAISKEEIKKLRFANGQTIEERYGKMAPAIEAAIMLASSAPGLFKNLYYFFNASVQAITGIAKLAAKKKGSAAAWAGLYFGSSLGLAIMYSLIGGDDDENLYEDLPEYERRNNLLFKITDDLYFKWSIPQEMRPFFAWANIIVDHAKGRSPHRNIAGELASATAEWLPVNPFGSGDPIIGLMPDPAAPILESHFNVSNWGGTLYNEMPWVSKEVQNDIPAYLRAPAKSSKTIVDIAEFLNDLTNGQHDADVQAGWLNINPAKVEHLLEGYGGGAYTFANLAGKTLATIFGDDEFTLKNTPFLNKLFLSMDETNLYANTNEMFYHYKGIADNAERVVKEYEKKGDREKADAFRQTEDWQMHLIFNKYEEDLKDYSDRLKVTPIGEEADALKQGQNAIREMLLKDIANLEEGTFELDEMTQLRNNVEDIDRQARAARKQMNTLKKDKKAAVEREDYEAAKQIDKKINELNADPQYQKTIAAGEIIRDIKKLMKEIDKMPEGEEKRKRLEYVNRLYDQAKERMN